MTTTRQIYDYDLVIVGASFAGLICARTAALRGLRVLVMERKAEPGVRPHTTGILVKEAADCLDLPASLTRKIRKMRLYAPNHRSIDLTVPGYYFLATQTDALLRWLAREAALAGAKLQFGCPFEAAWREGEYIRIAGLNITTRQLVGADGAKSTVAEMFGLGRNRKFLLGAEIEYAGNRIFDPDFLHCFLDRKRAPGYIGWAVPGMGITQVGIAAEQPHKPMLNSFCQSLEGLAPLSAGEEVGRRGGLIPVGGPVQPLAAPGVLLLGDAAGLVSPMTAGGIHNAFHFSRRAAQMIADHLLDDGEAPGMALAREIPRYGWKSIMRKGLSVGPPDWLFNALLDQTAFAWFAKKVYFHQRVGWNRPNPKPFVLEEGDPALRDDRITAK